MARFLSVKQIATLLQAHEKSVWRWVKQGKLPKPIKTWGSPLWDYDEIVKYAQVKADEDKDAATT